jgi:hypothetical protein
MPEMEAHEALVIDLRRKLAAARAKLAEARKDTERLDFVLDTFDGDVSINGASAMDFWEPDAMDADEKTELLRAWRAAIDAARKREEPHENHHQMRGD